MDVVSHCGFPVAGRVWKPRPGAYIYTFVCKATFALAPGKLAAAPEQQPVNEVDRPWSDSVTSLYAACDIVPRKLRPDVVLIGNAHAPGGVPAQKVVARLSVGDVDKSIEVWCDRSLKPDGTVIEGPYFNTLPLLYERAAGGPGTDNPVGLSPQPDAYGAVALPNLTAPLARIAPGVPIKPVGFGPIAARWPTRLARLGRYADDFAEGAWHEKPLPPDLDMSYFNVAPQDQQPRGLRNDERVVLENLHRDHAQLAMTLPGIQLRAKVTGPGGDRAAAMSCDTLWIDTSRGVCCLTYRGQVLLSGPTESGWVVVSVDPGDADDLGSSRPETLTGTMNDDHEPPTRPPARPSNPGIPPARPSSPGVAPPLPPRARSPNPTLPFMMRGGEGSDPGRARSGDQALPFQPAADSLRRADAPFQPAADSLRRADTPFQPPSEPRRADTPFQAPSEPRRVDTPFQAPSEPRRVDTPFQQPSDSRRADTALPFGVGAMPAAPSSSPVTPPAGLPLSWTPPSTPSPPAPVMPAPVMPAPVISAPVFSAPVGGPASDSPWAIAPSAPGAGTIAPVTAAAAAAAPAPGDFRSGGGALLASNAAAGVVEARGGARPAEGPRPLVIPSVPARPAPPKEPPDTLDLVFFEAEALPRIRRVQAWKKILTDLDDRELDPEEDDPAEAKEPAAVEERREIIEILLRAAPSDAAALDEALAKAAREDGRFFPPLLIVNGDLSTPFDEIETLKATVTTVSPLAGSDENLRASIEVAKDFLKLPGLSSSPQVAEGLTGRVRDAFNGAKRQVPAGYLDAQTERALVDQRFYQHRKVLGSRRQRALFHFAGSSPEAKGSGAAPLVAYLPESAGAKLPLYARFKVRILARVHLPLDQYEQGPALEAVALGRLCPPLRRADTQK